MGDFLRYCREGILHIQAVTEDIGKGLAQHAYLRAVPDFCNAAHCIQGIVQKMGIDLRLQSLVLRLAQQAVGLALLLHQFFHAVEHFIKILPQLANLILAYNFCPQMGRAALNLLNRVHQHVQGTDDAAGYGSRQERH